MTAWLPVCHKYLQLRFLLVTSCVYMLRENKTLKFPINSLLNLWYLGINVFIILLKLEPILICSLLSSSICKFHLNATLSNRHATLCRIWLSRSIYTQENAVTRLVPFHVMFINLLTIQSDDTKIFDTDT